MHIIIDLVDNEDDESEASKKADITVKCVGVVEAEIKRLRELCAQLEKRLLVLEAQCPKRSEASTSRGVGQKRRVVQGKKKSDGDARKKASTWRWEGGQKLAAKKKTTEGKGKSVEVVADTEKTPPVSKSVASERSPTGEPSQEKNFEREMRF